MRIGGLQKLTLMDYPGKVACIVFLKGCNFRCPFCHNSELVIGDSPELDEKDVLGFLEKRRGQLDGVVVTGGEPTVQKDLPGFLAKVKDLGYSVKLDTNGSNPGMLKKLIERKLVDYVAMDIKSSLKNYPVAAGVDVDTEKLKESVEITKNANDHEFRITAVPGIIDGDEVREIGSMLQGSKRVFVQQFQPNNTLDSSYLQTSPFKEEELERFKEELRGFSGECEVRK